MLCNSIPCSFVLFLDQNVDPAFITSHKVEHEVIVLTAYCQSNCDDISVCVLCKQAENPTADNILTLSCYNFLYTMVSYALLHYDFPNHHPSIPFGHCTNFLPLHSVVVLLSWWLHGWSAVSMFSSLNVFHAPSYIACTQADVHMIKSSIDVCSW